MGEIKDKAKDQTQVEEFTVQSIVEILRINKRDAYALSRKYRDGKSRTQDEWISVLKSEKIAYQTIT